MAMVYFIQCVRVDKIITELERRERHPEILDLALDAGTDGNLRIPFWGTILVHVKWYLFVVLICIWVKMLNRIGMSGTRNPKSVVTTLHPHPGIWINFEEGFGLPEDSTYK